MTSGSKQSGVKEKEHPPEEKQKTDVATRPANAGAVAIADFGEDAGAGMENVGSDELRVPFLYSMKSNSPQVAAPVGQGGVPGARAGMIMNMGTGELFDVTKQGVMFIPVHRDHNYVEFTPRNLGGGFVAVYPPDDPKVLELRARQGKFGKLFTGTKRDEKGQALDGTEISETFYLYGLLIVETDDGEATAQRVIVPFTSTQIKKYQAFMNRQTSFKYANPASTEERRLPAVQPPIWAHKWELGTVYEKNKKGEYYGWKLTLWTKNPDGSEKPYRESFIPTSHPLYREAKEFYTMLKEGRATADYGKAQNTEDGDAGAPM